MDASASGDGLLVFGSGASGDLQLVWMDRSGKEISTIADKLTDLQWAALSPQADRVALQLNAGETDIWVLDLARGVRTRLTFGPIGNVPHLVARRQMDRVLLRSQRPLCPLPQTLRWQRSGRNFAHNYRSARTGRLGA